MKIAVDFQSAQGKKTGIGVFASNVLTAISKIRPDMEWFYYTPKQERDLNTPGRIFWESVSVPLKLLKEKPDLVYSPGFAPAWASPVPQVVTVHDLIGMIYPENLAPVSRFYWSRWLPLCLKRARTLVASSESTRKDMARLLGVGGENIKVVPLAASERFSKVECDSDLEAVRRKYALSDTFLVAVGTLEPRKNIPAVLKAFRRFKDRHQNGVELALVGKSGGELQKIQRLIRELGLERHVKLLGYVPDDDLNLLYNSAFGYLFVSSYEGFGLPVLEAMRCGLSGICSQVSSIPEVAGETALYADPTNIDEMARQMAVFFQDQELRQELSKKALSRAREFSWTKTAHMMIEIFEGSV